MNDIIKNKMNTFTDKHLQQLLDGDSGHGKPKRVRNKDGSYTKLALKWNVKMLREGRTTVYADTSKVFNPQTNRLVARKNLGKRKVVNSIISTNYASSSGVVSVFDDELRADLAQLNAGDVERVVVDLSKVSLTTMLKTYLGTVKNKRVAAQVEGTSKWIALSHTNVDRLLKGNTSEVVQSGSDHAFPCDASMGSKIVLEGIDYDGKDKLGGGFFKHYHTLKGVDLSRYDIYENKPTNGYRDNCLYKCFESWGLEESKLALLKQLINQNYVANFKLRSIAETLGVHIKINKVLMVKGKESTKTEHKGDLNAPMIHIATYDNHYFLVEKTTITKYAFEHYHEIKHMESWHNIVGPPRDGRDTMQRRNGRGMSSLDLVRGLLKLDYVRPIPVEDMMSTQFWSNDAATSSLVFDADKCCRKVKGTKQPREQHHRVFIKFSGDGNECWFATDKGRSATFAGPHCARELALYLPLLQHSKMLIISHNSRHDFAFLSKHIVNYKPFELHGTVKYAEGKVVNSMGMNVDLVLMDSTNLYGIKEADLGTTFTLKPSGNPATLLKEAYEQFRLRMLEATGLDTHNYNTLPTLANDFLKARGCYDGCYEIAGVAQKFIHDCVVGGKVCLRNDNKQHVAGPVVVLDANSLYAHAMSTHGFIKGIPKVIPDDKLNDKEWLLEQNQFFVEVEGLNDSEPVPFPVVSVLQNKSGKRVWTHQTAGKRFFVDKHTAQDIAKHQHLAYKVVRGYYFDQGTNDTVCGVIKQLYQKRLEAKGTPMDAIYKAVLTSSYGCTMVKAINTRTQCIPLARWKSFFVKNYNYIQEHHHTKHGVLFKVNQGVNQHFNCVHIGCSIVGQSKQLMTEAIGLSESTFYTDTDSLHIKAEELPALKAKWKTKNKTDLIGNQLGQFKIESQASRALYVGKKSYLLSNEDGTDKTRMKAVPQEAMVAKADNEFGGDMWGLYERLSRGEPIAFVRDPRTPKQTFTVRFL